MHEETYFVITIILQALTVIGFGILIVCAIKELGPLLGQVRIMADCRESDRNTRYAELITSLANRWDSDVLVKSRIAVQRSGGNLYKDIVSCDNKNDYAKFIELMTVANFFDTIGVLVVT